MSDRLKIANYVTNVANGFNKFIFFLNFEFVNTKRWKI
jgi:hypothetical protein